MQSACGYSVRMTTLQVRDVPEDVSRVLKERAAASGRSLSDGGRVLTYDYDTRAERTGIGRLLADLNARGLGVRDVATKQTSLEEVFISLVSDRAEVTADVEPSGVDRQEAIIAAEGRA